MAKKARPNKPSHGGARLGAGRKPLPEGEARRKRTVWLTDQEAEYAMSKADTLSEGVRLLIAESMAKV